MNRYVVKRFIGLIVVLMGVSILSFLMIEISGTDPAEAIARRASFNVTREQIEVVRLELGLDRPIVERYFRWLAGILTGDAGMSTYSNRAVIEDLRVYLPITLTLVGLSLAWVVLFALPVSLVCARYPGGILDHVVRWLTLLGICTPTFWLGFMLLILFAVRTPIFSVLPEAGIKGYLLPSLTLAVPILSAGIRILRGSLLSEANRDYVTYLKARGHTKRDILYRHMLPNALPPIITLFCQYLGYLIAGSAVVESVFSLKGIGTYLVGCILAADSTAVAACVLIVATVFVLANLMGDLINRMICPWMVRETND